MFKEDIFRMKADLTVAKACILLLKADEPTWWNLSASDRLSFDNMVKSIDLMLKMLGESAEQTLLEYKRKHPRAIKLLQEGKNFLVVSETEDYFKEVYGTIRSS